MKKLVILLILLCAAGAAAWFIYREAPSGPEDKAVLYGNVDLRQVDLAFLISERIDSVLVDEGDTGGPRAETRHAGNGAPAAGRG